MGGTRRLGILWRVPRPTLPCWHDGSQASAQWCLAAMFGLVRDPRPTAAACRSARAIAQRNQRVAIGAPGGDCTDRRAMVPSVVCATSRGCHVGAIGGKAGCNAAEELSSSGLPLLAVPVA